MRTHAPENESILQEAQRITHGDRQQAYGHPSDDYERVSGMLEALKGWYLTASDIALIMLCVKISREVHNPKRDNRVDIAGFAWVLDRCRVQEEHDYAQVMNEATAAGVPVGTDDIPAFLRSPPPVAMTGIEPRSVKPYGEGLRENVIARAPGKTMAERIAETEAKVCEEFPLLPDDADDNASLEAGSDPEIPRAPVSI